MFGLVKCAHPPMFIFGVGLQRVKSPRTPAPPMGSQFLLNQWRVTRMSTASMTRKLAPHWTLDRKAASSRPLAPSTSRLAAREANEVILRDRPVRAEPWIVQNNRFTWEVIVRLWTQRFRL